MDIGNERVAQLEQSRAIDARQQVGGAGSLPSGWEVKNLQGRVLYVNHATKSFSWVHPSQILAPPERGSEQTDEVEPKIEKPITEDQAPVVDDRTSKAWSPLEYPQAHEMSEMGLGYPQPQGMGPGARSFGEELIAIQDVQEPQPLEAPPPFQNSRAGLKVPVPVSSLLTH